MSSLSDTAVVARKSIKYGSIGLVALLILRMMFNAALGWWRARNPDPPPPPDVQFGKLPELHFPESSEQENTYRIETATGNLPSLDDQFQVYFMPIRKPSLLAYDEAARLANRLDFIQEPTKLSDTTYRWSSSSPVPSSLTVDIITGEFVLDRRWQDEEAYLTPTLFMSTERAVEITKNFLSKVELLPEDIRSGNNTVQFLRAEEGELREAVSLSKSQFLRVNLYRAPVEEVQVVNPLIDKGLITAIVALQRDDDLQFVNVKYSYFPVDLQQSGTYPLIGVVEAWQRLQNNQGYVVAGNQDGEIPIREIYLAYYDADTPQQFLQPVYVFEGDGGFRAYVRAVSDEWIESGE